MKDLLAREQIVSDEKQRVACEEKDKVPMRNHGVWGTQAIHFKADVSWEQTLKPCPNVRREMAT